MPGDEEDGDVLRYWVKSGGDLSYREIAKNDPLAKLRLRSGSRYFDPVMVDGRLFLGSLSGLIEVDMADVRVAHDQ